MFVFRIWDEDIFQCGTLLRYLQITVAVMLFELMVQVGHQLLLGFMLHPSLRFYGHSTFKPGIFLKSMILLVNGDGVRSLIYDS